MNKEIAPYWNSKSGMYLAIEVQKPENKKYARRIGNLISDSARLHKSIDEISDNYSRSRLYALLQNDFLQRAETSNVGNLKSTLKNVLTAINRNYRQNKKTHVNKKCCNKK